MSFFRDSAEPPDRFKARSPLVGEIRRRLLLLERHKGPGILA